MTPSGVKPTHNEFMDPLRNLYPFEMIIVS